MEKNIIIDALLLIFGVLFVLASVFNWNYFFNLRKAQILTKSIGLTATRIIYAALGAFFALVGANHIFDLHWLPF